MLQHLKVILDIQELDMKADTDAISSSEAALYNTEMNNLMNRIRENSYNQFDKSVNMLNASGANDISLIGELANSMKATYGDEKKTMGYGEERTISPVTPLDFRDQQVYSNYYPKMIEKVNSLLNERNSNMRIGGIDPATGLIQIIDPLSGRVINQI